MKKFNLLEWVVWILAVGLIVTTAYAQDKLENAEERIEQQEKLIYEQNQELEVLKEQKERLSTLTDKEEVVRVVMAEANDQSLKGKMAVAQVILDRSIEWGMSSGEVVNSPYQFATPCKGEIDDLSSFAVDLVYLYGERVFDEPTTHFYNYNMVEPYWSKVLTERGVIGEHCFMG